MKKHYILKSVWIYLICLILLPYLNQAQTPLYDYDLQANECILLDDHTTIIGQFPSGMNAASVSGNTNMDIQGAFAMYIDNSTAGFSYIPSGDTLFFQPGPGGNSSYKFASFLVDWMTLAGNTGSIRVDFSDGREFIMQGSDAILLDNLTQFPILGGFQDGVTYRVEISGNPQMPQQSVFVMYVDNGETKFGVIPIGETLTFAPGSGDYKFCAFQVDWSYIGDNFNSTNIKIYEKDLTNGLVAYYPFNGNANDESGNGHHGSIISNPFFIADRHGNQNSALSFDGIDDWIEVNNSSLFPSDAITICYWINRDGNDITSFQNYISKELSFQSFVWDYSGSEYRLGSGYWLGSPGVWTSYGTNYEVTDLNDWIFYAFSYDNNTQTAKSYVNGILDSIVVETDPNYYLRSSNQKMFIGRNGSANVYHIEGFLDDIRIYDRALTDEEIFQLYDLTPVGNQVTVTSPNGGEVWGMGTEQSITWSSIDVIDVKIEFSSNNGATWNLVTESTPSTGIYLWTVPAIHTIQALVKITDVADEENNDQSDDPFTIEPVTSAEIFNSTIPDQFELKQNYPNPFNPTTTIYYGLPNESSVRILIYDILGSNVMRFTKDNQPAGYHTIKFDASNLPSGIYFYRIQAGDFIQTKKMILLK